ncbi:hypothetical protein ACFLXE_00450 [Chloroflexota bacterium]
MSAGYEKKLEEFIEGKTFIRLSRPVRNRADAWCDACGSLEPHILFGLSDESTDRYFFVGAECLKEISQRGAIQRRYCRENAEVAFAQEMARRRLEGGPIGGSTWNVPEIRRLDTRSNDDADLAWLHPQVFFWETPESYLALVQVCYEGDWVWGGAEAPRFREVWERCGSGEVVLQRVPCERSQALEECVRRASDDVRYRLRDLRDKRTLVSPGNGHHDWTGFWEAMRDLGLEREDVVGLSDGLMPRDWLNEHPEASLEDLLRLVQSRYEQRFLTEAAVAVEHEVEPCTSSA